MKSRKRKLLVAVLAAFAISAIARPAMAMAAVWKDFSTGAMVSTNFSLGLTGGENYEVETSAGGVSCSEHMTMAYSATSKATQITAFENKGCAKTFGTYATCTVQTVDAIGLPWSVTLGPSDLTVNNMQVKHTFKVGCPKGEISQMHSIGVLLKPEPKKITEME